MSDQVQGSKAEWALTFGEKAAGVSYNPSKDPFVDEVKKDFAAMIDKLHDARNSTASGDKKRYYSKAISYLEDAKLNAVTAITWEH